MGSFVGGQHLRYTGKLKFYCPQKGMENLNVEFGIVKTKGGQVMVDNMTLPGGIHLTQENLEGRRVGDGTKFSGTVSSYSWKQGWGFIAPDPSSVFPNNVQAHISKMQEDTKARGKTAATPNALYFRKTDLTKGCKVWKGTHVTFRVYVDEKGAGACDISV